MTRVKHWWNAPKGPALIFKRWGTVTQQKASVSKRARSKLKRAFKKKHGLNRSQLGAIGAGHMDKPA